MENWYLKWVLLGESTTNVDEGGHLFWPWSLVSALALQLDVFAFCFVFQLSSFLYQTLALGKLKLNHTSFNYQALTTEHKGKQRIHRIYRKIELSK